MQKKNKSITYPDYYNNFFCKQDTCRSSCCHGWKVTISRNDYFKLIGLTCSPQLRSSLDTSLYLNHDASPEYYAEIARKWDGKCPCETDNGLCKLQLECGETSLPKICRCYPRIENASFEYCVNSCEKVVEMLCRKEKINFSEWDEKIQPGKKKIIEFLQNRDISLEEKLIILFKRTERGNILNPENSFHIFWSMIFLISYKSDHIAQLSSAVKEILDLENPLKNYFEAQEKFSQIVPEYELYFENILVNYILSLSPEPVEIINTLCVAYTLLKVLVICNTAKSGTFDSFVDSVACAFRYIQHSDFERISAAQLKMVVNTTGIKS